MRTEETCLTMPRTAVEDNSRMSLRIPREEKAILLRAAALKRTDLTDFVRQHTLKAAKAVIREEEHVSLSVRDSLRVMELLENPPAPNAKLLAAAKAGPGWPTMVKMAPSLVADADALAHAYMTPAEWARVVQPVLLMVGESTRPIFPEAAEALAAAIPNTTSRTISARDHSWDPKAMADALAEFLAKP